MKNRIFSLFIAGFCIIFYGSAHAAVGCRFTVSAVNMYADGWLYGKFNGENFTKQWTLCPVGQSITVNTGYSASLGVSPDACKGYYTQLLTARASRQSVVLTFQGPASCSASALPADGANLSVTLYPASLNLED